MRRYLSLLIALTLLAPAIGCKYGCWRGVCDCQLDDQCIMRQPWLSGAMPPAILGPTPVAAPVRAAPAPAPAKLMPAAATEDATEITVTTAE